MLNHVQAMNRCPAPSGSLTAYLHPRELFLLGISSLVSISILLVALCGVENTSEELLIRWAQRPWARAECNVQEVGISYLGDCDNIRSELIKPFHVSPTYNYTRCHGATEDEHACERVVKEAFGSKEAFGRSSVDGRRLSAAPSAAAAEAASARWRTHGRGGPTGAPGRAPLRALKSHKHLAELCHDEFLPWVRVEFGGGISGCGYRTGLFVDSSLPKLEGAEAKGREFTPGTSLPCWQLRLKEVGLLDVRACHLVALEDPETWSSAAQASIDEGRYTRMMVFWGAVVCAVTAAAAAVLHHCCWSGECSWRHCLKIGAPDGLPFAPDGSDAEDDSQRVRHLRDRWWLFRANVLAEYRPVHSAREFMSEEG